MLSGSKQRSQVLFNSRTLWVSRTRLSVTMGKRNESARPCNDGAARKGEERAHRFPRSSRRSADRYPRARVWRRRHVSSSQPSSHQLLQCPPRWENFYRGQQWWWLNVHCLPLHRPSLFPASVPLRPFGAPKDATSQSV